MRETERFGLRVPKAYKEALDVDPGHWPALRGLTRVAHHMPDLRRLGLESMLLEQLSDRETRANAEIRIALSLLTQQRDAFHLCGHYYTRLHQVTVLFLHSIVAKVHIFSVQDFLTNY